MAEAKFNPRVKRQIRVEKGFAYIQLTKGFEAVIDVIDVHLVEGRSWQASVARKTVYATTCIRVGTKQVPIRLHRLLLNPPPGMDVDHVDCDGLNNCRSNLRLATNVQNQFNKKISSSNTSGLKGVTWHKQSNKWQAQIVYLGKCHYLGLHACPHDAKAAYQEASVRLHGDFGRF